MAQNELLQKCNQMLRNRCTPKQIKELKNNEVMVFGSKPDGHHNSGAAMLAVEKFGAVEGKGEGLYGQSYAIPVHCHRTEMMADAVSTFINYAKSAIDYTFYVLPIGCGNAGMKVEVVAEMFKEATKLENVFMPETFIKAIRRSIVIPEDEELPIKYVDEAVNADCLRGRMMGLMAEISKRTDKPITFEDDILKESNILLHAFLRVVKVVTKEEQRVMNALMDEATKISETEMCKESENGTIRSLKFVCGWKLDAKKIFEEGGCMYDLLTFTSPDYIINTQNRLSTKGYHGKLEDGKLEKFESDGKYGLRNKDGKVLVEAEYDDINSASWTGRGWKLKKNDKWGAVNERCEWMFPLEYDSIKERYEGGHYLTKDGKMGFCNEDGIITIDFLYDELENYSSSWSGAKAKLNDKWGYLDEGGNVIVPIEYDYIDLCSDEMIKVKKNDKYGFYNTNNNIIPLEYDDANSFYSSSNGETKVKKNGKWGVIDTHGEIVLPIEYENVNIDSANVYRVEHNGIYGIIDKDKHILFPFKYKDLGSFDDNGITYAKNGNDVYGYVDKKDNVIIPFTYFRANNFRDGYAEVAQDFDKRGVIDASGKVVVPLKYHYISIHWDDIVEVRVDDRIGHRHLCGLYDLKTGNILPCIYEEISPKGRDRGGIMECDCWRNRRADPITVKVNSSSIMSQNRKYYFSYEECGDFVKLTGVSDCPDNLTQYVVVEENDGSIVMPNCVDGKPITQIEDYFLMDTDRIVSARALVIPSSYKRLGKKNFSRWNGIECVVLYCGASALSEWNFAYCDNLKNVICMNDEIYDACQHVGSIFHRNAYGIFDGSHNRIHFIRA